MGKPSKPRCAYGGCAWRGREKPLRKPRIAKRPPENPKFCSTACAAKYGEEQAMDMKWCGVCSEWDEIEHNHGDTDESSVVE